MHFVQNILGQISKEYIIKVANHCIPAIFNAQPVDPISNEKVYITKKEHYVYHSPKKNYLDHESSDEQQDSEENEVDDDNL